MKFLDGGEYSVQKEEMSDQMMPVKKRLFGEN
jgi:hypothetical protein